MPRPVAKLLPRRRQSRSGILLRALKGNQENSERSKPWVRRFIQEAITYDVVQMLC
jgi:hypothetical protein